MSELLSKCHVTSFFFSVYSYGVQLGCSSVGFDFICLNEYAQSPTGVNKYDKHSSLNVVDDFFPSNLHE
jgi:hypothetical protein